MTPRIIPETSLTKAEDAAIRSALCECFPADRELFAKTRAWHGTYPAWSVLVENQDRVIAHVGIVEQEILVGAEQVHVAGIQNVLVVPEYRKTDLFRRIMLTAVHEAHRRGLDLGLLFCTRELARIYGWLGWRLLKGRSVVRVDETGLLQSIPENNVTMFYPLRRPDIPAGDIHLLGNDW